MNIVQLDELELDYNTGPFMNIVQLDELELEYSTGPFMNIVQLDELELEYSSGTFIDDGAYIILGIGVAILVQSFGKYYFP